MSTENLSFLNDSILISALDVMEIFGRGYQVQYSLNNGFYVSEERISCIIGDKSFSVHIVKSDVMRSILFLDQSDFPVLGSSLFHHEKFFTVELSGPTGKIIREIPVYSIQPMIWSKNNRDAKFADVVIKNHHSEHRFNGVSISESDSETEKIILPVRWKMLFGSALAVELYKKNDKLPDQLPIGLLTENDIRMAIIKRKKIRLQSNQKITPAALELGNANHIFIK